MDHIERLFSSSSKKKAFVSVICVYCFFFQTKREKWFWGSSFLRGVVEGTTHKKAVAGCFQEHRGAAAAGMQNGPIEYKKNVCVFFPRRRRRDWHIMSE